MMNSAVSAVNFLTKGLSLEKSPAPKKQTIFEELLNIFQGSIYSKENFFSPFLKDEFSKSSEKGVQKAVLSSDNKAEGLPQKKEEISPIKNQEASNNSFFLKEEIPHARFMEGVYFLFGNTSPSLLINNVLAPSFTPYSMADEINFLVEEILDKIQIVRSHEGTKMDFVLKRDLLGAFKISLNFENNQLKVEIFFNQEARLMMEPHLKILIEKLQQAGIEIGAFNIYTGDTNQQSDKNLFFTDGEKQRGKVSQIEFKEAGNKNFLKKENFLNSLIDLYFFKKNQFQIKVLV